MKQIYIAALAAAGMGMASCSTISNTAQTERINTEIMSYSTAELVVSPQRVTYTYVVDNKHNKAGEKSCKAAAVEALLAQNGNAAVLVAPQYEVKKTHGKVKYVKVSGFPATYKNVHQTTREEAETVNLLEYPSMQIVK